jgi:hypothetical protein
VWLADHLPPPQRLTGSRTREPAKTFGGQATRSYRWLHIAICTLGAGLRAGLAGRGQERGDDDIGIAYFLYEAGGISYIIRVCLLCVVKFVGARDASSVLDLAPLVLYFALSMY